MEVHQIILCFMPQATDLPELRRVLNRHSAHRSTSPSSSSSSSSQAQSRLAPLSFSSTSYYVVPPPSLCSDLITISTPHHKGLTFPIHLKQLKFKEHYPEERRNSYEFCCSFVFDRKAGSMRYELVVSKTGRVLTMVGESSRSLSRSSLSHPLPSFLEQSVRRPQLVFRSLHPAPPNLDQNLLSSAYSETYGVNQKNSLDGEDSEESDDQESDAKKILVFLSRIEAFSVLWKSY